MVTRKDAQAARREAPESGSEPNARREVFVITRQNQDARQANRAPSRQRTVLLRAIGCPPA
jgi:hypothetical protein